MGETNGNQCSIFSMRSTASMLPSRVPRGRTEMAKSIARFLVAVMAVAAMALASAGGTGLAQAQTNTPTDRAALVVLHNATDGPNWNINTNWLSDRPIGEWHGVTTNSNGRVIKLDLFSNQLTGEIPPELGGLTSLQVLHLWGNELTGTIPVELGNLTNLTSLTILALGDNELTGPIPTELGNLTSLAILNLSANQLTGEIPAELGRLDKLEELHLSENLLTGCIPARLQDVLTNDLAELGLPFCGDSLVDRYDTNGNKMIDKNEVIAAINDYLFGEGDEAISKAEVIRLINLYLFAPPTPHNPPHVILRVVQVTED